MLPENAIEVENVTKKFKVYLDKGYQLKEKVLFSRRNRYEERCVLRDISFDVKKGEAVGLIGKNGCGKSTALKLLTKIIYPDKGTIETTGRLSSLIELGAGFHPDMSGRENIYTNAAIFGLTKKEIDERMEEIIAFSELEQYIDNPVRTYSSGMYMRLAFSVAINVDAEILLIDEILAVGDAHFQAKCFNRLRKIKADGTTIVIVSHSTSQIEQICDRAIWIKDGRVEQMGLPRDVIGIYMSWVMGTERERSNTEKDLKPEKAGFKQSAAKQADEKPSYVYTAKEIRELKKGGKLTEVGNHELEITDYELLDKQTGKHKVRFGIGESILLRICYRRKKADLKEAMVSLAINRNDGLNCYSTNCFIDTGKNVVLKDEGMIEITLNQNPFMQGEYNLDLCLNKDYGPTYHGYLNACAFEVYNITTDYGVCRPDIMWNLDAAVRDCGPVDLDAFMEQIDAQKILTIKMQSAETDEMSPVKEYEVVRIDNSVRELGAVKGLILSALNHAKYLLVPDAALHHFDHRFSNNHVFENNGKKELLIPLSTKNKMLISDIVGQIREEKGKSRWLLDCFKAGELSFCIMSGQLDGATESDGLAVNLINHTDQKIHLLDEGIAFAYHYGSNRKEEGVRSGIRPNVYPGNNLHQLDISPVKEGAITVSVVKEGEYWINHILPECEQTVQWDGAGHSDSV